MRLIVTVILAILVSIGVNPLAAYAFAPRTSAPDRSNAWYYSSKNPYYVSNLAGQCTWYAWGRASEILGTSYVQKANGSGGKFWDSRRTDLYQSTSSDVPRVGALACASGGSSVGHVAVVESIESNGTIVFSEYWGSGDRDFHLMRYASGAAWARGSAGAGATFQGYIYLTGPSDNEAPIISNVQVEDVSSSGYTVSCTVEDNVGVKNVLFPSWSAYNDQDDIVWHQGTRSGNTWTCRVSTSDHNDEVGLYLTHIYAYDTSDNSVSTGTTVTVPEPDAEKPVISNVQVEDVSSSGYTVSCNVTDNVGVDHVKFPTWTSYNGQDDLASGWESDAAVSGSRGEGDIWYFRVDSSEHNSELGEYVTDIYAYDTSGNVSKYASVIVNLPKDISNAYLIDNTDPHIPYLYNGQPIELNLSYMRGYWLSADDDYILDEGVDYRIVGYENNVEPGTAVAIIEGIGGYEGTLRLEFKIYRNGFRPKDVDTFDAFLYSMGVLPNTLPDVTFTGAEIRPSVVVYDTRNDSIHFTQDKDYSVSYENNLNVGTAKLTLEGKGYCTGTREMTFNIKPANMSSVTIDKVADQTATGSAIKPKVVARLGSFKLVEGVDYTLTYNNNIAAGRGSITINGKGNFIGNKTINFNIVSSEPEKISISGAVVSVPDQTYTGTAKEPTISVTLDGKKLAPKTDYTVTYANNINAGKAEVTVKGVGSYEGTVLSTFTISPADLSNAKMSVPNQTYSGSPLTPVPTVTLGNKKLEKDTDYRVGYENNVEPGTATVVIKGIKNYKGTNSKDFAIAEDNPASIVWKRLAGDGRYDTMAEIVSEGWSGRTGGTVVIATGEGYKDALAAAGIAGLDNAPVILTAKKSLSQKAESTLRSIKPKRVYVAGGPAAVSNDVVSAIQKATDVKPIRISGRNSVSTSAALATAGAGRWKDATAIIATNASFKDALSVAPVSYAKHWPIILADNGRNLNAGAIQALRDCGITQVYIVGGKLAVTSNVENQLSKAGVAVAGRLEGKDGVHTSRAIADFALQNGLSVEGMAYATSQNYPDALAGAALSGKNGSVLLLCDSEAQYNLSFSNDHKSDISQGYVYGGELAFSASLFEKLPK